MNNIKSKKIFKTKTGLALFLVVLCILLISSLILIYQNFFAASGTSALVYQDGELLKEVDLDHVKEAYTFTVYSTDGGYNTLQVEPGRIGVIDTDCPDKICQHMGMTSSTIYPISCLPHRLVIRIVTSGNQEASSDTIDTITK